MRVRNISKKVKGYMKIHRQHMGKTVVVHNLHNTHKVNRNVIFNKSLQVGLHNRQTDR